MIKNVLIKISGDVSSNLEVLDFIKRKSEDNYTVVVCGAGTKIGEVLKAKGYEINFDKHGRMTESFEERKIIRDILEEEQMRLQDELVGVGVNVVVPIIQIAGVLCHINGDAYVKAGYLGFDEIYVFTLRDRVEKKKKYFSGFEKVEILGL
ncbi:MAG TPA: hypothetical protein ENH20_00930 [Candidatus Pacearchaeota archaeon]|nr:hypothetical protein [Candidatus Pacearchaeota archaeon]